MRWYEPAVDSFLDRLFRAGVNLYGFELSVNGEVAAEGYRAPLKKGEPYRMYSISKSVVSLGIGMLIGDGRLSLDDRIADYFPDYMPKERDGRLERLTIRDMLRMATCHRATAYMKDKDVNWTKAFFTFPPDHEPGTVFSYDTSSSQALASLISRISGKPLLDFLEERLFNPIGANDEKRWLADPSGAPQGGTGLCMSLRDMAKVARLVARGGDGLVPADYIAAATSKQIDTPFCADFEQKHGYGYQLWRTREGWSMYGKGGQLAICSPARRLLMCTIADTQLEPFHLQELYDAFFEEIAGADTAANASGEGGASEPALRRAVKPQILSGDSARAFPLEGGYAMLPNAMGLTRVSFEQGVVRLARGESLDELAFAPDGERECSLRGQRCLVSAGFVAPRALRVRCHMIGDSPCGIDLLFGVSGAALTVRAQSPSDPLTVGYEGFAFGELER